MARKNLLKGLMEEAATKKTEPDDKPRVEPRYSKGAIGAVSQQIAELKSRSVVELDPFTIKAGGLKDRLDFDEKSHQVLMASLKEYGQQVPVLVRPDPEEDGAYQIVYGRRRVLAMRDLKMPVKALIRDLDDEAAILAQGQENSARRDLSFIERVNFARQMVDAGYDRKVIGDALSTDKTLISRMLQVAEAVPVEVIERIGSAPGIGRDRWLAFSRAWTQTGWDTDHGIAMADAQLHDTSDARFEALLSWMEKHHKPKTPAAPKADKPRPKTLQAAPGKVLGKVTRGKDKLTVEVRTAHADGFDTWLEENIEEIFRDWQAKRGE